MIIECGHGTNIEVFTNSQNGPELYVNVTYGIDCLYLCQGFVVGRNA